MTVLSSYKRDEILDQMAGETLDVLVIGGGITGAGIALDAKTRGLKTGLVEMQDFAAGTSSRSTKLVHGGLRYLKQFEVKMVAEVGKEREIVYENGPHVTTPEWMMLPFYKGGNFGPFTSSAGLHLYDWLAGVKKSERREMLNPKEALRKEPLIKQKGLKGAGYYVEYKTDDARMTIEVVKKAAHMGALAINYAKSIELIYDETGRVNGVIVEDQITGATRRIHAKKVVNATGPWVDDLREMSDPDFKKHLYLTKGVHLVFSQLKFPLEQAIYFDAPDGRMIFAIPREGKTYVGTTDTQFTGNLSDPAVTAWDRDYILEAVNAMFVSLDLTLEDVESSWAGVRPLIAEDDKNPDEISRKDEIFISDTGLISIAGGKLTGYRKMAEDVVDLLVKQFKQEDHILYSVSQTKQVPISGGEVGGSWQFPYFKQDNVNTAIAMGIGRDAAEHLVNTYGSNSDTLFKLYQSNADQAFVFNLHRTILTELMYAIDYEMAYKPADFFVRRTGDLYFDIETVKQYKTAVMDYMAEALEWSQGEKSAFKNELEQLMEASVHPA